MASEAVVIAAAEVDVAVEEVVCVAAVAVEVAIGRKQRAITLIASCHLMFCLASRWLFLLPRPVSSSFVHTSLSGLVHPILSACAVCMCVLHCTCVFVPLCCHT